MGSCFLGFFGGGFLQVYWQPCSGRHQSFLEHGNDNGNAQKSTESFRDFPRVPVVSA